MAGASRFFFLLVTIITNICSIYITCTRSQLVICRNARSCMDNSIVAAGQIQCRGYLSCANAMLESTSNLISCHGSFSCYQSSVLTAANSIYCYGLFSCLQVVLAYFQGNLYCWGEKSCYNGKFIQNSDYEYGRVIDCTGQESCAQSIFIINTTITNVYLSAHLASTNSVFYSNLSNFSNTTGTTNYYFYGEYSGYNATIICENEAICNINCYANGCNKLNLICNANCSIDCTNAEYDSNICPNGYNSSNFYQLPNLNNITISTYDNSINVCNATLTGGINCDDQSDSECQDAILDLTSTHSPVCCTASSGCWESDITIDITSSSNPNSATIGNIGLRCDGGGSCREVEATIIGNVYMSGSFGMYSDSQLECSESFDIFCAGFYGCWRTVIQNSNNLYCLTELSCKDVDITNVNTVFAYGLNSLQDASGVNTSNVYCGSYTSCSDTTLINIENVCLIFCFVFLCGFLILMFFVVFCSLVTLYTNYHYNMYIGILYWIW